MRLNYIDNIDCLEGMKEIPDGSVDMVLCDLPYGTTKNKWDVVIPFEPLWAEYNRVCKPNAAIVLTATPPFSARLGQSNIAAFKYSWYWKKPHTGQLNSHKMPLKNVEEILVFYKNQPTYNPQYTFGDPYVVHRKNYKGSECYGGQKDHSTFSDGRRFPMQILEFTEKGKKEHPTQKPVALLEYLIKTYTDPGEVVLDNCMGSGTTAVACIKTGRNYIGFELDEKYHAIAQQRIADALAAMDEEAWML